MTRVVLLFLFCLSCVAVGAPTGTNLSAIAATIVTPNQKNRDVVTVTSGGVTTSAFCTTDGRLTIIHGGSSDANGAYHIGQTLLVGKNTYRLSPGNALVAPGCYDHRIAFGSATGDGRGVSTVWYIGHHSQTSVANGGAGPSSEGGGRSRVVAGPPAQWGGLRCIKVIDAKLPSDPNVRWFMNKCAQAVMFRAASMTGWWCLGPNGGTEESVASSNLPTLEAIRPSGACNS